MTVLFSLFVGCILQAVVESKNNFLVYNTVSISFNIKVCWLTHKNSLNVKSPSWTHTRFPILNTIIKYYYYLYQIIIHHKSCYAIQSKAQRQCSDISYSIEVTQNITWWDFSLSQNDVTKDCPLDLPKANYISCLTTIETSKPASNSRRSCRW